MAAALSASAALGLPALRDALAAVGVARGTGLVLHSSLRGLGKLDDVPVRETPRRVVETILDLIGEEGTLCVPAPNWDYGRKGEPFDLARSPVSKELGVVSAYVTTLANRKRSPNPIFSVAAIGGRAAEICGGGTGSAFGTDSPWERMYRADFLNVLLGCDLASLTFARFIEHRFGVPYLYTKVFDGPVLDSGRTLGLAITAPVRFHSCPAEYDLARFEARLRKAGFLREAGSVKSVGMKDCFAQGTACLKEDVHFFLKSPPAYLPGEVPLA